LPERLEARLLQAVTRNLGVGAYPRRPLRVPAGGGPSAAAPELRVGYTHHEERGDAGNRDTWRQFGHMENPFTSREPGQWPSPQEEPSPRRLHRWEAHRRW